MVGRKLSENITPGPGSKRLRKGPKIKNVVNVGSVDGLPDGWSKEIWTTDVAGKIRIYLYYKDPASSYLFYSKRDALRYIQTGHCRTCKIKPKKIEEPNLESTGSNATEIDSVDVLLDKLSKEIRTKDIAGKIKKDANYKDHVSGLVYHSAKDALRYVETGNSSKCNVQPKKIEETGLESTEARSLLSKIDEYLKKIDVLEHYTPGKSQNSISREEEINKLFKDTVETVQSDHVESTVVDGLPPGWIKQLKSRKNGKRRDTYYVEAISGYMFSSKPDALRYIETGELKKCAWKPMKIGSVDNEPTQIVYRKELKKEKLEVLKSLEHEQMDLSRRLCH